MILWLCPEVLFVLAGVGLILVDCLSPQAGKRFLGPLAVGLAVLLFLWVSISSGRPMPESWSNLVVTDGLSSLFKPFFAKMRFLSFYYHLQ